MHERIDEVTRALAALGLPAEVRILPERAHTAVLAAEQLGIEVGAIANSLVFDVGGNPLLVMTSGGHRVDTAKVARLLGVPEIAKASAAFVRTHTGQAIGGVAPIGHPGPIGTLVDIDLARYDQIWAAAGHPSSVFATTYADLLSMTSGTPAEVA